MTSISILDEAVVRKLNADEVFTDVVCLGWYDGPLSGMLAFRREPSEYKFDLVDDAQTLDFRVFTIAPLPRGTIERFKTLLTQLGHAPPMHGAMWCPIWHFPSDSHRSMADTATEELLLKAASPVAAFCWSLVNNSIIACRLLEGEAKQEDWFAWLGLDRPGGSTEMTEEGDS